MSGYNKKTWLLDNGKYVTGRPPKWTYEEVMQQMNSLWDILVMPTGKRKPEEVNAINANNILSIKAACVSLGFSSQRVSEWKREYADDPDFVESYQKIIDLLETRIQYMGMNKSTNAAMPIFMLKNLHGYSDKIETKQDIRQAIVFPQVIFESRNGITGEQSEGKG